jgi:PAS domain S-box-containing protein
MNNLKTIFSLFFSITIACLLVLGIVVASLLRQQFLHEQIDQNRFESYLLANELKQSSDDLTKFCMVYVNTADPEWEKKYWDVLDIRNGKKPRPDGRMISLKGLMKELGFSDAEFKKLKTAEDNSNALVHKELTAFNLMKGLYDDGTGHFTIKGVPDPKLAQAIMFDKKYHTDKAVIMRSIEEFNELLTNRIEHKSKENEDKSYQLLYVIIGIISLIIVITVLSFFKIKSLIRKLNKAEKITHLTMLNLEERVKELKVLHGVSNILHDEDIPLKTLFREIVEILPAGSHYPDITAARVCFSGSEYFTGNYRASAYCQRAEVKTASGSALSIEVVYLQQQPEPDEGEFLNEKRNLINTLAEMIKTNLDRREQRDELKDYKYAIDISSMVSIAAAADGRFTYVNDNFCKTSKFSPAELLGKDYRMIMSNYHSPDYFQELRMTLQKGKPFRGEYCTTAKDGTLYWIDTTIVPILDDEGKVYQYLSINHDITERKEADEKIKQSEQLLKKITSQIPGNTYMFSINEHGDTDILFMSLGTDTFNISHSFEDVSAFPELLMEIIHADDQVKFSNAMKEAYRTESMMSFQYRMTINGTTRWRWMQAVPGKDKNGKTVWYGATSDIDPLVEHIASIEQIIFDIGHVIRRPVSSMLGMSKLIIDDHALNGEDIKEISQSLYQVAGEMDQFIHRLNTAYQEKRRNTKLNIDISKLIDTRNSLFE